MKTRLPALILVAAALALAFIPISPAAASPAVTIELLNPPANGLLELAAGESYIFIVEIASDEPFVLAAALTDAYYPGRGVYWHGGDRTTHDTTATLYLTMTGKNSTAGLEAVCGWPEAGTCWPAGVAPASIVAGARFKQGLTFAQEFAFAVRVP
jgi:hypothetical protein